MTVLLLLVAILLLLVLRVPVAFAFLGPGLAYLLIDGQSLGLPVVVVVEEHLDPARREAHDEAVLFCISVLGLQSPPVTEAAGPHGLVRSQVMRTPDGGVRLSLNVSPVGVSHPDHVALECDHLVAVARRARENGLSPVLVPDNYYDDLRARFGLDDATLATLREHQLLFDRSPDGELWHFSTQRVGGLCIELVQRVGEYDAYATDNTPVLLAAQDRADRAGSGRGDGGAH